jgi:hypothetical protein
MEIWSSIFLAEEHDWATCSLPINTWRRITEENPATRLIAEITYLEKKIYVALGTPTNEGTDTNNIYVPSWLVDHLGIDGCGQDVDVKWLSQDCFPEASRIVLRPHDSAFYHADAKEELERALTRLGVIHEGDTAVIPLGCLGEYQIAFDIIKTEPANLVLAQGDEVAIEFEEALDAVVPEPVKRPDTPIPPPIDFTNILPSTTTVEAPVGKQVGGEERFMPDGTRWNPWKHGPWSKDFEGK